MVHLLNDLKVILIIIKVYKQVSKYKNTEDE